MHRLRAHIWLIVAIVVAVAVTAFTLSDMVLHPSHIIPELGGDGAKNNFTYLYHCMYGKGYWFEGMNYPYGEHIVYTDGQPLLSVLLASAGNVSPETALTVVWMLVGLGYVLAMVFTYKTLVRFRVAEWAAIAFAALICIFTPQVLRLQGHYALSYTCVIPMLFYWTIRYNDTLSLRWCAYIFMLGCVMSFLHPYYAAIMLVWAGCYAVGYVLFGRAAPGAKLRHAVAPLVSVVAVLVVIAVVMKVTDPVTDRPVQPLSTFYETCTRLKQIVSSVYSPVWHNAAGKPRLWFVSEGGEGYTYVGLAVLVTAGICFFISLRDSIRQRALVIYGEAVGFPRLWLFMAIAILLFAMGVPFIWHMEGLLNYLSVFRQFRSFGRFSWLFYQVITVYAAVIWYHSYLRLKATRPAAAYTVLLVPFLFWCYEAGGYVKYTHKLACTASYNYRIVFMTDEQNWSSFLADHHYRGQDFQAVLIMPFFHIGSEKLWVGDPSWLVTIGARASLQLRLPMVDVMMSRSSWSQAQAQVKIAGGCYTNKPILDHISSGKPFLLLNYENDSLNPDQKYLTQASDYIGHFSQFHVYACYPARIAANDTRFADSIAAILPYVAGGDTVIGSRDNYFADHCDQGTAEHFFGQGATLPISGHDSVFRTLAIVPPKDTELYEFSAWFLVGNKNHRTPYITLEELNDSGRVIAWPDALTKQSTDSRGLWFRAGTFFRLRPDCVAIRLRLVNDPPPSYLSMDELLLRPAGTLVISRRNGKVLVNNHMFPAR